MLSEALTPTETSERLREALRDYIEATYHISEPHLIKQRRELLDSPGVIYQKPYIETTPQYETGDPFENIGLDSAVVELFESVSTPVEDHLIYDPPYVHQQEAIRRGLVNEESMLVMTGTGSGKTECFLLPILGKLAKEARDKSSFKEHDAVRAILLYPMNALVNDQLGRLREMFGDDRIRDRFMEWGGRPARFARYTSRTLYPGVRTKKKDKQRLRPIKKFYIRLQELAEEGDEGAQNLIEELKGDGKWPAKPNLRAWYGEDNKRWKDEDGEFQRCVTLNRDAELLTRHEVLEAPPDVLITNYSMLEYMLMRPIERPVFDKTSRWLSENPDEKLLLVVDEAHLYRGASGAEVALLLRRLRKRLDIPEDRLQVICTSASFQDLGQAAEFGANLTGKNEEQVHVIDGDLKERAPTGPGGNSDVQALLSVDIQGFHEADSEEERLEAIRPFLDYQGVEGDGVQTSLFEALKDYPPMGRLVNKTMEDATPPEELAEILFPDTDRETGEEALTALMTMGSVARESGEQSGLLPSRIHAFFRGLPGLWACPDKDCTALSEPAQGNGNTGKIYGQPRETCECGARVFELYTCRNCGTAFFRAYTDNLSNPKYLWAEPGARFRTAGEMFTEQQPLDVLLSEPRHHEEADPTYLDLVTGRLNPLNLGDRCRTVWIPSDREADTDQNENSLHQGVQPGQFHPCPSCGDTASNFRSSVQDHRTKGDPPFQALVTRQIEVQPPNPDKEKSQFAPLRGRKSLIFSDSRQKAARLSSLIQENSTQDVLRPLIVRGFEELLESSQHHRLTLEDAYLAVLVGASKLGVRLRPALKESETFSIAAEVDQATEEGVLEDEAELPFLVDDVRSASIPESLLRSLVRALTRRYYGLEALALGSITETDRYSKKIRGQLPDIEGVATTPSQKAALVHEWLSAWARGPGIWFSDMDESWWGASVDSHTGNFRRINQNVLASTDARKTFKGEWIDKLTKWFCEPTPDDKYRLKAQNLSLEIGGDWAYCDACRTTQRPFPRLERCTRCGREDSVREIDPDDDEVFSSRKRYYREDTVRAVENDKAPVSLIAAEHTAQINSTEYDDVFSRAEEFELLFQDIDIGSVDDDDLELGGSGAEGKQSAIDVLSCTTTMEVGIDIGSLSGVALRNIPPSRANYQQRAGRAGRRGNALATVVAYGNSDSHDNHFFRNPDDMIRGDVSDPTVSLDNKEIAKRHVRAYLLQRYHRDRLPAIPEENQPNNLFEVLGSVESFRRTDSSLNRDDFESWLHENESDLRAEVDDWLPAEIEESAREALLDRLAEETLKGIDEAIGLD